MLFFFLVPWIAFCLCLASPLPELFRRASLNAKPPPDQAIRQGTVG